MMLLVGLGNPGRSHVKNRHNVGYMAIDAIATFHNMALYKKAFKSSLAEGQIDGVKVLLLKPETYMNRSGEAVSAVANFYKISQSKITVFYDDIDLTCGKLKIKMGGGTAGHNGLENIISYLGAEFRRVRIGIGHPGHKDLVQNYVLSNFTKAELVWLKPLLKTIAEKSILLVRGDDGRFLNDVTLTLKG